MALVANRRSVMNLFSSGLCPHSHSVRMVLAEKGITVEIVDIDITQKPEDLLDLNRKRFDSLYAGDSLMDKVSVQQELATELGKRTASWVGDLQEVAGDLQSGFSEAANELVTPVAGKAPAARSKKAKAA